MVDGDSEQSDHVRHPTHSHQLPLSTHRIGDALSDEELNCAMVNLDETTYVEQYSETEDGQSLHVQVAITELWHAR